MSYGEIYDDVCLNCFGGNEVADVPTNMIVPIRKKIKACQRMLNRDYNFWFTIFFIQMSTTGGTASIALPERFKEMEKCYFTIDGQSYGGPILGQLDITEHLETGRHMTSQQAEYPNCFRVDGTNLYLYPVPSDVRTLNILCWKFLPAVPVSGEVADETFDNYEDDFSRYCADCIVNYVTAQIKLQQDEWQSQQIYMGYFNEALEGAMMEDKVRRSVPEARPPIGEGQGGNNSVLGG